MKKSCFLTLFVLLGVFLSFNVCFADLVIIPGEWSNASNWAKNELEKAQENYLIPTSFRGLDFTKNITREGFAEVAVKLYESISKGRIELDDANPFTDTDNPIIVKAYYLGITSGTSETTFSPDKEITREELATMICRTIKKLGFNTEAYDITNIVEFKDQSLMHDWSKNAIYYMAEKDIIKGVGDGFYGVNEKATIEQSILISQRCFVYFSNFTKMNAEESNSEDKTNDPPLLETPVQETVVTNKIALQAFNGKFERYFGNAKNKTVAYQLCDLITTNNASRNGQPITFTYIDLEEQSNEFSDVATIHEYTSKIIKSTKVKYDISGEYDSYGYLNKISFKEVNY